MLGLDQKTLRPISPGVEDNGEKDNASGTRSENEKLDRAEQEQVVKARGFRYIL